MPDFFMLMLSMQHDTRLLFFIGAIKATKVMHQYLGTSQLPAQKTLGITLGSPLFACQAQREGTRYWVEVIQTTVQVLLNREAFQDLNACFFLEVFEIFLVLIGYALAPIN